MHLSVFLIYVCNHIAALPLLYFRNLFYDLALVLKWMHP